MGNTHLEPATKENLLAYNKENGHRSASRGVDALLAEHRELLVTRRENELLHRMVGELDYRISDSISSSVGGRPISR